MTTMKTRTLGTAALPALAALALAAGAPAQAPDAYDLVLHAGDVMVPMRDGVRLATDVYRPARGGVAVEAPLPILLQRTPYGKERRGLVERAAYFVRHGYVVVLQDTRAATSRRTGSRSTMTSNATDGSRLRYNAARRTRTNQHVETDLLQHQGWLGGPWRTLADPRLEQWIGGRGLSASQILNRGTDELLV